MSFTHFTVNSQKGFFWLALLYFCSDGWTPFTGQQSVKFAKFRKTNSNIMTFVLISFLIWMHQFYYQVMLLLVDDHSMSLAIKKLKIVKVSIPATLFLFCFIYYLFI